MLQALWVVMLKAAGFQSVRLEDRSWDAEAPRSDKNRRRPDIVCIWGGVRYVIDITIAWKTAVGHVTERDVGHDADKKAADKERKYKAAMKRQLRGLPGWLAKCAFGGGRSVRASGVRGVRVLGAACDGLLQFRQAVRGLRRDEGS